MIKYALGTVLKTSRSVFRLEFLNLIIRGCEVLSGLKISDIDQLILALIFRFGVTLV